MEKLMFICFILVLAWSLSSICKELQTSTYLARLIGGLFGDHTSPISNTTALALMGSGCHWSCPTQLTYALITDSMAIIGYMLQQGKRSPEKFLHYRNTMPLNLKNHCRLTVNQRSLQF